MSYGGPWHGIVLGGTNNLKTYFKIVNHLFTTSKMTLINTVYYKKSRKCQWKCCSWTCCAIVLLETKLLLKDIDHMCIRLEMCILSLFINIWMQKWDKHAYVLIIAVDPHTHRSVLRSLLYVTVGGTVVRLDLLMSDVICQSASVGFIILNGK